MSGYKFNPFTGNLDSGGADVDLASPGPIGGTTPDAGTFTNLTLKGIAESATEGPELITNGSFSGNADGWTLGQNWAYGNNNVVLTLNAATEGTLSQTISGLEANTPYKVSWSQTHSAANNGGMKPFLGTSGGITASYANTTGNIQVQVVETKASESGDLVLSFTPSQSSGGAGTITIDSVSVKKLSQSASLIDAEATSGEVNIELRANTGALSQFLGKESGRFLSVPSAGMTAFGYHTLRQVTTGRYNSGFGYLAIGQVTTGEYNAGIGWLSLGTLTSGSGNTAVGPQSLQSLVTGGENTAVGRSALFGATSGSLNTAVGRSAGRTETAANGVTSSSLGTFIGAYSGPGSTNQYDYATAIGAYAKVTSANTVVLGRTTDNTVIGATGADGSNALLQVTGSSKFTGQYINASTKTLTESSDTAIVDIAVAAGTVATGEFIFGIEANDATDYQTLRGRARYAVVNKGGTLTVDLTVVEESKAVSAGTLTATCTATSGTNKITLNLNAVSSLTQTTLRALWRIEHEGGVITAL